MKTHIEIKDVQDVTELIDILQKIRKLRQSIYVNQTEDFTVEVETGRIEA